MHVFSQPDFLAPAVLIKKLQTIQPKAKFVLLKQATHASFYRRPESVFGALLDFYDRFI